MINWNKTPVTSSQIQPLCSKYNIDQILASIFVRRGVTDGKDILYYLEEDLRFQNEPFMLPNMDDAVERIVQAMEEDEKILIFGDSDVDGVTSTAILYHYLKKAGAQVQWRLPMDDDAYGLSIAAVDDFASQEGTLIITVDCGISNNVEVAHANDLGIDVIVTDHHNPPENLPEAIVVIDPKLPESIYPFKDISGAAVAYKLVSALRYATTDFYNSELCILELTENQTDNCVEVDCVKIKNNVRVKTLHEVIRPGITSIYDLKLPYFLQGQLIYTWDVTYTRNLLKNLFGSGIEFNLNDLRQMISTAIPALKSKSAKELTNLSLIAKYIEDEKSVINSLYNLYVSFCKKTINSKNPDFVADEKYDLQLVGLAALADIMPMKNENRIFVKNAILSIKKDKPCKGLAELFAKLKINCDIITSTDLSWAVIPALNAAGRLGQPDVALKLLISESGEERQMLADRIVELNEERKNLVQTTVFQVHDKAQQSVTEHQNKLCVVVDENIHQGLTGLFAAKLMSDFGVPAIAVTFNNDICIGSIRSNRSFIATDYLDTFGDFFINHGGHNAAAGFSFERHKLEEFLGKIQLSLPRINLTEENSTVNIDAELPVSFLTPEIFNLLDTFEPYGNDNEELVFFSKQIKVIDAMKVGKKDPMHLKLTFECGKFKFPGMYWGQGNRLNSDIKIGNSYDILFTMNKNYFNGVSTNQLIIKELY